MNFPPKYYLITKNLLMERLLILILLTNHIVIQVYVIYHIINISMFIVRMHSFYFPVPVPVLLYLDLKIESQQCIENSFLLHYHWNYRRIIILKFHKSFNFSIQ